MNQGQPEGGVYMKRLLLASCFSLFVSSVLSAQETSGVAFQIGAGFTQTVGNTGRNLDNGWNIQGGFGYNFNSHIGALVDVGFHDMGINSITLNNLGFPGGDVHIFQATLDPIVHLTPKSHVDIYLTGGGGIYHRYQEFTAPTVATIIGFNPFFGLFPVQVPANQVIASSSAHKPDIHTR